MRTLSFQVFTAVAVTVAVGLVTNDGWAPYFVGAVLALALWVMLFFGSYAGSSERGVGAGLYATAAFISVGVGTAIFYLGGGENAAWWAPGFILGGVIAPPSFRRGS